MLCLRSRYRAVRVGSSVDRELLLQFALKTGRHEGQLFAGSRRCEVIEKEHGARDREGRRRKG